MTVLTAGERASTAKLIYVVVFSLGYDGSENVHAYFTEAEAIAHTERLNGVPYDKDNPERYQVWTIPFGNNSDAPSGVSAKAVPPPPDPRLVSLKRSDGSQASERAYRRYRKCPHGCGRTCKELCPRSGVAS